MTNYIMLLVKNFYERTKKIALTDSWAISKEQLSKEQQEFMKTNCVHYVASSKPLGENLGRFRGQVCAEVSAGHQKHEYTTGYAYPLIYK